MSHLSRTKCVSENSHLCETRTVWPEEFCKQGPCRFGRSAAVRGGITGDGGGVGRRRDVLVYRNAPAGSRLPRSWPVRRATLACAAGSVTASSSPPSPSRDHAARGTCGSGRAASRLCGLVQPVERTDRPPAASSQWARLIRPKSFIYHFAAKALLALI